MTVSKTSLGMQCYFFVMLSVIMLSVFYTVSLYCVPLRLQLQQSKLACCQQFSLKFSLLPILPQ